MTVKETGKKMCRWFWLIVPPCFVLPLAATPPDFVTSICWVAAGLAGIGSVFSIIVKIWVLRRKREETKPTVLIRPALTLLFILFSIYSVRSSLDAAKEFARSKANEIQKICKTGKCPELIEGWTDRGKSDVYRSQTMEGNIAKYAVRYRIFNDFKEFEIYLRVTIDISHVIATGGTEKELIITGE